jgi:hypothetical protein
MSNLPMEIISILAPFLTLFSQPVSKNALTLIIGAILCKKQRTVASCLKAVNLQHEVKFTNYHRVLNKSKWNCLFAAKILLGLIIKLLPAGFPVYLVIDDTLERRKGKKISSLGCFRDAIRSSSEKPFCCFGLRWLVLTAIIFPPWCKQPWALPFLVVLTEAEMERKKKGKRHKKKLDWARQMIKQVTRWFKGIQFIVTGDSEFACIEFGVHCVKAGTILVSRLKINTRLFDSPPQKEKKVGRPRKLGKRLPGFKELAKSKEWKTSEIRSYGGKKGEVQYLTGTALLYRSPFILPIRWVLVKTSGSEEIVALFSTDLKMEPEAIIETFVLRWNIEVTFELAREHLGIETQRQWSDLAIQRTTPILFGLYSIITLIGIELHKDKKITEMSTAWYKKGSVTFSDVLVSIRREIWKNGEFFFMKKFSEVKKIIVENQFSEIIEMLASTG